MFYKDSLGHFITDEEAEALGNMLEEDRSRLTEAVRKGVCLITRRMGDKWCIDYTLKELEDLVRGWLESSIEEFDLMYGGAA